MLSAITFITGLVLVTGICNDRATFTQVVFYAMLGVSLMLISLFFSRFYRYKLEFIAPNGNHKIIYAYNLAGKILATRKYTKLGYQLETEWEIIK
jgi:uncharacterized membrane protein YtjA (UPF0391 family)